MGTSQQLRQSWAEGSARFDALVTDLSALRADAPDEARGTAVEAERVAAANLRQSAAVVVDLAAEALNEVLQRAWITAAEQLEAL